MVHGPKTGILGENACLVRIRLPVGLFDAASTQIDDEAMDFPILQLSRLILEQV